MSTRIEIPQTFGLNGLQKIVTARLIGELPTETRRFSIMCSDYLQNKDDPEMLAHNFGPEPIVVEVSEETSRELRKIVRRKLNVG